MLMVAERIVYSGRYHGRSLGLGGEGRTKTFPERYEMSKELTQST